MGTNNHSVFLLNDGTVKTVGHNRYGQCGTGSAAVTSPYAQLSLYTIPSLNNIKQISCGQEHTVFLLNDGTVKTVGSNDFGQCGTGNTTSPQLTLYTIPSLNNVKQVACGSNHTVFLLNDGTVKTVGRNDFAQCGTGNTTNPQSSLYTIPNLSNVKQVSCGQYHTVFLLNDGTVKTVGYNSYGQCGTGSISPIRQLSLYNIPDLNNVKQVSCGSDHTVFLLNDGTVKTVGYNQYGQCGTGNTNTPQLTLYTIPNLNNVKQVSCGYNHTIFLLNDGTVKTVGHNNNGQCGTNSAVTTSPYAQLSLYTVPDLNNVKQVSCGSGHTVFLLNDGTVKTVGQNTNGQCGRGNTTSPQLSLYTIPNLNNTKSLWDIPELQIIKYLLKQYNNYYSIKPEYYNTVSKTFTPLTLSNMTNPNKDDIELFGFDNINDLNKDSVINGETFKPIDKLYDKFDIKVYKSK